jgi:hypothetical protein
VRNVSNRFTGKSSSDRRQKKMPIDTQEDTSNFNFNIDQNILPRSKWEKGGQLLSCTLLLSLIAPADMQDDFLDQAQTLALALPIEVFDRARQFAEALADLRFSGGFVVDSLPEPKLKVFRSKAEAVSFLRSTPSARQATDLEIEMFLIGKTYPVVRT